MDGLERMVSAMDGLYNAKTTIHFRDGLPPVINHPTAAELAREAAGKIIGPENVVKQRHPSLVGKILPITCKGYRDAWFALGQASLNWQISLPTALILTLMKKFCLSVLPTLPRLPGWPCTKKKYS